MAMANGGFLTSFDLEQSAGKPFNFSLSLF
jgi:hypothetical protein